MKTALLHEVEGLRTIALVLETGEEAMAAIGAFAIEQRLGASHFTSLGAFSRAVVAYFDWTTKQYRQIDINEQVEVLSLVGDIVTEQDRPKVLAHVVLGKADATAHGGHLIEGYVRPTLELVVTEAPRHLRRRFDPASGLALIDPDAVRRESGVRIENALARDGPGRQQFPFGFQPVVDICAVGATAFEEAFIGSTLDLVAGDRRGPGFDGRFDE